MQWSSVADSQPHELELTHADGSLDLLGRNEADGVSFDLETLSEGTDWGNPESVRRAMRSAIVNGSVSTTDRYDNRTITLRVKVSGGDGVSLAAGERALMLAAARRAELKWTPPATLAAPAVFVVVNSDLKFEFNDQRDHLERIYVLTLEALPHTRSASPVVIEATPAFVGAPTVLDECTSTAGWSGTGGTTFTIVGTEPEVAVWVPAATVGVSQTITLTKTLARTKRYLAIKSTVSMGVLIAGHPITVTGPGGTFTLSPSGSDGGWLFYDHPHGDVSSITMTARNTSGSDAYPVGLIDTIGESDAPSVTAGRQSLRVLSVLGSAPASGSLVVRSRLVDDDSPSAALGQVIVYSGPEYDPRLSTGRVDAPTLDATAMSGVSVTKTDGHFDFVRPASAFYDGAHSVWVHAKGADGASSTVTVNVYAIGSPEAYSSPADALATVATLTNTVTFAGTGYNLFNLGRIDLPGFDRTSASQLNLRIEIAATGTVTLEETLVFNVPLGSLTVVDTRSVKSLAEGDPGVWEPAIGASRVWLDAASLDNDERVIAGRRTRDLSLPVSWSGMLRAWDGAHRLTAPATYLYVGTTEEADPVVTGEFYPTWHTHPAV